MRLTLISAAVLATASFASHGAASLGGYSFDYNISGDRAVRPVQAFDDGRSVYIQLPVNMAAPPAVLEKVGEQVRPIRFRYEFPYLVVDNAPSEIVLAFDGRTAFVAKRSSGVVTGTATTAYITGAATSPVVGAAAVSSQPASVAQPRPADRSDYSGEMVYRQMRGSSLVPSQPTARVAAAPVVPVTRAPVPAHSVASSAVNVESAQRYMADGSGATTIVHRVARGETLGTVAARYGVPARRIAADNGITNPNLIRLGQALTITKPGRSIMASAEPQQTPAAVAAVAAPARFAVPVVVERAEAPVRVAAAPRAAVALPPPVRVAAAPKAAATVPPAPRVVAAAPAAAPVRVSMAPRLAVPERDVISEVSPSGRVEVMRLSGVSPKIDAKLLAAVRRAVARNGEIMLRGHSSALTAGERSATANASAESVRDQLIKNGIPADRLTLVSNPGRVMSPSRVDVVLIGSRESVDA